MVSSPATQQRVSVLQDDERVQCEAHTRGPVVGT